MNSFTITLRIDFSFGRSIVWPFRPAGATQLIGGTASTKPLESRSQERRPATP
jgi:hypothetical protein